METCDRCYVDIGDICTACDRRVCHDCVRSCPMCGETFCDGCYDDTEDLCEGCFEDKQSEEVEDEEDDD